MFFFQYIRIRVSSPNPKNTNPFDIYKDRYLPIYFLITGGPVNELRDLLLQRQVNMVHIDEFRTSARCFRCGGKTEKRRHLVYQNGATFRSHGCLKCQCCHMVLDRDLNAAYNIRHICYNYINNIANRPSWLVRPANN